MPQSPRRRRYGPNHMLSLWVLVAMLVGVGIGYLVPGSEDALDEMRVGTTNIPIAAGLILIMVSPLVKVRYEELGAVLFDRKIMILSLVQNWLIGPLLMFALAVIFLRGHPEYMTGLILVGLARCIAMVLDWNELANGDTEYAAGLVVINSVVQVLFYGVYAWVFITVLPEMLGLESAVVQVGIGYVAWSVFIYLGIPLLLGMAGRYLLIRKYGREWFESVAVRRMTPVTLVVLLLVIAALFVKQGDHVVRSPMSVVIVAIPMVIYFLSMFVLSFWMSRLAGADYRQTMALSLTAASSNFELAIAVAISVFGLSHGAAFVAIVGPLVEVPMMTVLVNLGQWLGTRWFPEPQVPVPGLVTAGESEIAQHNKRKEQ